MFGPQGSDRGSVTYVEKPGVGVGLPVRAMLRKSGQAISWRQRERPSQGPETPVLPAPQRLCCLWHRVNQSGRNQSP